MSTQKHQFMAIILSAMILGLAGWFSNLGSFGSEDYVTEIRENIALFGQVYRKISQNYVEPIEPDELIRVGIDAMLDAVDPYTVLIEREDNAQLQIMTTGKYGGLGMLIGIRDGWPTVVEPPYEGTPALRAGLREGDHIIAIDGVSTKNQTVNEVASKLRGEIGTAVTVTISREGESEPIEFRLIRAEIVIKDVNYAGIVEDGVGYIKLTRFSKNAGREVRSAIRALRDQGMRGLILDLRNNPGGLLEAAVSVAESFVPKGKLIVSTRGRIDGSEQYYYSDREPVLGNLPLVVLVNEASASASEIVSGAIQDLDRGVLIGQPTFGKGLVQSVLGLTRDTRLKLTTAKYYLPSGRLIQKDRSTPKDRLASLGSHPPISAKPEKTTGTDTVFTTEGGRMVLGGGGIKPDIILPADTLNRYQIELLRKSMVFNYAVLYANTHENLKKGFEVTGEILQDFKEFLRKKGFSYTPESEEELQKLREALKKDGIDAEALAGVMKLEKAIESMKEKAFERNIDFIKEQLAKEISAKLWGTHAKIEVGFARDRELQEAIGLIKNPAKYRALLATKKDSQG